MPLVTKLTRAIGVKHPILCGGMHHVGFAPLAAAVSMQCHCYIQSGTRRVTESIIKFIRKHDIDVG